MKLWRREREQPVAPDLELEDRIADVLHRYGTRGAREGALYVYKSAARRRQLQTRGGEGARATTDARSPVPNNGLLAVAPQPPASFSEPVPSHTGPPVGPTIPGPVPSAEFAEGPALGSSPDEERAAGKSEAQHDRDLLAAWEAFRKSFEPLVESNDEYREYFV